MKPKLLTCVYGCEYSTCIATKKDQKKHCPSFKQEILDEKNRYRRVVEKIARFGSSRSCLTIMAQKALKTSVKESEG